MMEIEHAQRFVKVKAQCQEKSVKTASDGERGMIASFKDTALGVIENPIGFSQNVARVLNERALFIIEIAQDTLAISWEGCSEVNFTQKAEVLLQKSLMKIAIAQDFPGPLAEGDHANLVETTILTLTVLGGIGE